MSDRRPASMTDPRSHLRDEMRERKIALGRFPTLVREWMRSDRPMTADVAGGISRVFGTSPAFWLNLDASYQRWKETHDGE